MKSCQYRRTSQLDAEINVALLNGHSELLTLLPSSTVQDVRTKAQRAFGKKCLRLVTAKNRVLVDFEQTLEEAEIEAGECLTALVLQPQLAATGDASACGVMEITQSLPGALQTMAATVRQQFWKMETKDFVCLSAMLLFLCCAVWQVNASSTWLERVEFECLGC